MKEDKPLPESGTTTHSGNYLLSVYMADERRKQERFFLSLEAKISQLHDENNPGEEKFLSTVAANISCGGAYLRFTPPLPLASRIKVEFHVTVDDLKKLKIVASAHTLKQLANSPRVWVQATGVVIRHDQDGMAIIFDKNYQFGPMRPGST